MNSQKQSGLDALLTASKTLLNNSEKKCLNECHKESLENPCEECHDKSLENPCEECHGKSLDEAVKIEYTKIIDEQNKKIESLENQLKEALNANLVRLIQEYI